MDLYNRCRTEFCRRNSSYEFTKGSDTKSFFTKLFVRNLFCGTSGTKPRGVAFHHRCSAKLLVRNFYTDYTKMVLQNTSIFTKPKKVPRVYRGEEPFQVSKELILFTMQCSRPWTPLPTISSGFSHSIRSISTRSIVSVRHSDWINVIREDLPGKKSCISSGFYNDLV